MNNQNKIFEDKTIKIHYVKNEIYEKNGRSTSYIKISNQSSKKKKVLSHTISVGNFTSFL